MEKKSLWVKCQYLTSDLKVIVILIAMTKFSENKIKKVMEDYGLSNKVISISLDNASNGIGTVKMLCDEKIIESSFNNSASRCFAHILNLCFVSFVKDKKKPSNITIEQSN
ncbi:hypothetical protein DICPUDRAFT_82555 [Dictyostelium purpureum]|uniref:HAT C-terminal dimerisation domain-containing protein n=1 Tax=Dictyostelium purpureum TaxID=5786 RepID=F0ZWV8_DICPU|nr:uncharacterized protein DICPUDRAFT_82555 [Dictyostelium purpureum]EGC31566.1 hypothetical protein DICPUDRAFT_82555 [Dictyostelium purpureum]|eukprot:XP_003291908.1 hypothetical protein DICPUDRAFT_82555 [Dictyostelium purpureum]